MTDPKEAAIARLHDAFHAELEEWRLGGSIDKVMQSCARIAIEKGVLPVWFVGHSQGDEIPWDAVCPAAAEGEK